MNRCPFPVLGRHPFLVVKYYLQKTYYLVKKRWIHTLKAKPVRPTPLITLLLTAMLTTLERKLMEFVVEALNQSGYLLMILLIQVLMFKVYF